MNFWVVAILLFATQHALATVKESELCIIEDDTFYINVYDHIQLLESSFDMGDIPKLTAPRALRSSCFRGYIGTWTLIDSCFYLKSIGTHVGNKNINDVFESISSRTFTENGVLADWITGTLYVGLHFRYPWQNAFELGFHLENGKLLHIDTFGSEARPMPLAYSAQDHLLMSQIDLPTLEERIRATTFYARVYINKSGKLDSLHVEMDSTSTLHQKLFGYLENITYWGQCFNQGKPIRYEQSVAVSTDKRQRKKYARMLR